MRVVVDLALGVPIMDVGRAREELGWSPAHTADEARREVLDGMRDEEGARTPALEPDRSSRTRAARAGSRPAWAGATTQAEGLGRGRGAA